MKTLRLLGLIVLSGLFYFSEGKPCPEKTRPHKSRCDAYFKCILLPSKSHVWVPEKCEQGLIYEPNLRLCVLPGDDWECNLGDSNKNSDSDDDNVLYGVGVDGLSGLPDPSKDHDPIDDSVKNSESDESTEDGKGADYITVENGSSLDNHELEASGDGEEDADGNGEGADYIMVDTTSPESKTSDDADLPEPGPPPPTKIDPKLTAHLQRLSQLIDGLKQTYQSKDSAASELRPDQLNAFLAHYNIKSQLDSLNPSSDDHSTKVDEKQQNRTVEMHSTTPSSTQLDPETKVVLSNHIPSGYQNPRPTDGYSNSQIVVNKPEGSVLFTLGSQQHENPTEHRYDPKISEETLKTVLELSKQMIENQNVRRVIPSSAYYPQVVQPIYLPPPIPQYANSIFNQNDGYGDKKYDKVSSNYYGPQGKPAEKPATTIIHNNVIPVHVSASSNPDENNKNEPVDSYGQKLNSYPPLSDYQYSGGTSSSETQDHQHSNRYENNQLVTIRPNQGQNNYNNYQYNQQQGYRPTTTSRPYISDSGSTLTDYYTPSPHLDETNVNNVFQVERYPTINYGNIPSRPPHRPQHSSYTNNYRPQPAVHIQQKPQKQQNPQYYQSPYENFYYPSQQSILQLFPSHINPSQVNIRPNSQKLESMEQEIPDENDAEDDYDQNAASDVNQSQTYNQFNANKQITASQLAQYVEQLSSSNRPYNRYNSGGVTPSRKRPSTLAQAQFQSEDESQLASFNGNTFPYDLFQTNLLPSLGYDEQPPKVECTVGVRQPNVSDCTRYFVCSKEDENLMKFTCPTFTAFNPNSRLCEEKYYNVCKPSQSQSLTSTINRYAASENQRIQLEAIKALQNSKRLHDQAQRLRLEGNKYSQSTPSPQQQYSAEVLSNFLQSGAASGYGSVTPRPQGQSSSGSGMGSTKKRKYYCKEGDKVPDQTSIYSYFVCYKNAEGMMKGHKMTCSQGLLFCPTTLVCTLAQRCS